MKRALLFLALAACHHADRAPDVVAPIEEHHGPVVRGGDQVFLDGEALLARGPDELTPRARITVYDHAWLRADGGEIDGERVDDEDPVVVPVSESLGTKVRVLYDSLGDLALLVWIDRASLGEAVTEETGVASGEIGVRLLPGAPLREVSDAASSDRRTVTIEEDGVEIYAEVSAQVIGALWVPAPAPPAADGPAWIDDGVDVRAAADPAAPVLAHAFDAIPVSVGASRDGWAQVTLVSQHAIVRGYVPASEVAGSREHGTRDAAGAAPTVRLRGDFVEVPVGACVFDRVDGERIGVTTSVSTWRIEARSTGANGQAWLQSGTFTDWGDLTIQLHDTSPDPAAPALERCVTGP